MLPTIGEGTDLDTFLPPPSDERARSTVQRRAAVATTLMAGLELGREGVIELDQGEAFGPVRIRPGAVFERFR